MLRQCDLHLDDPACLPNFGRPLWVREGPGIKEVACLRGTMRSILPDAIQLAGFDGWFGRFLGLGPVGVSGLFNVPLGHLGFGQPWA